MKLLTAALIMLTLCSSAFSSDFDQLLDYYTDQIVEELSVQETSKTSGNSFTIVMSDDFVDLMRSYQKRIVANGLPEEYDLVGKKCSYDFESRSDNTTQAKIKKHYPLMGHKVDWSEINAKEVELHYVYSKYLDENVNQYYYKTTLTKIVLKDTNEAAVLEVNLDRIRYDSYKIADVEFREVVNGRRKVIECWDPSR